MEDRDNGDDTPFRRARTLPPSIVPLSDRHLSEGDRFVNLTNTKHERQWEEWELPQDPWVVVQPQRYRYALASIAGIMGKIALSEYLACEVMWDGD